MLIGIGGRKGSGKSILSSQLINNGFEKISFADPLKKITSQLYSIPIEYMYNQNKKEEILINNLKWNNEYAEKLSNIINIKVSANIDIEFNTIRQMLQFVGTEVLRNIDQDFHINKMLESLEENKNYICDDFRFKNEKERLEKYGAEFLFLIRPDNFDISNHESEIDLKWGDFKYIIENNKPLEYVIKEFNNLIKSIIDKKTVELNLSLDNWAFYQASVNSALWAGFLFSHGTIKQGKDFKYLIEVNSENLNLLDGFRLFACLPEDNLSSFINENNKRIYSLNIYSSFVIENLKHWNFTPNNIVKFDPNLQIPDIIKKNSTLIQCFNEGFYLK